MNGRYVSLGGELKERLGRQQASLELRHKAVQGAEELRSWLTDKESSLKQGQTASPSKPEVVRAQAQANKVSPFMSLFLQHLFIIKTKLLVLSFSICATFKHWYCTRCGCFCSTE